MEIIDLNEMIVLLFLTFHYYLGKGYTMVKNTAVYGIME